MDVIGMRAVKRILAVKRTTLVTAFYYCKECGACCAFCMPSGSLSSNICVPSVILQDSSLVSRQSSPAPPFNKLPARRGRPHIHAGDLRYP